MIYIVRFSEIFLKGKNKKDFEKKLIQNIKSIFKDKILRVENKRERIIVYSKSKLDLKRVFGIYSYSEAIESEIENIKKILKKELPKRKFKTFRISSKRIDKNYAKSSMQINKEIGQFVVDSFDKKVSLKSPELDIGVEILQKKAYIFFKKEKAFSGLPVGIEGKVYALIENNNSILAALLMMKRGCSIIPIASSKKNIKKLQKYSPERIDLKNIKKIDIKEKIIVTGQTYEDFTELGSDLVLRPLISFDKDEARKEFRKY